MKLYEISEAWRILTETIENEEMDPEAFKEAFDDLKEELNVKAENIIKIMKNINGDVEAFKAEEKRLYERRKAMENNIQRLKEYLFNSLKAMELRELDAGLFKLRIQNNAPSVWITNEDMLSEDFKSYEVKVDKKAIMDALKEGKPVSGAELKQGESLRIR